MQSPTIEHVGPHSRYVQSDENVGPRASHAKHSVTVAKLIKGSIVFNKWVFYGRWKDHQVSEECSFPARWMLRFFLWPYDTSCGNRNICLKKVEKAWYLHLHVGGSRLSHALATITYIRNSSTPLQQRAPILFLKCCVYDKISQRYIHLNKGQ